MNIFSTVIVTNAKKKAAQKVINDCTMFLLLTTKLSTSLLKVRGSLVLN